MSQAPSNRNLSMQALYEPEFTYWLVGGMLLVFPAVAVLSHLHEPWMPLWGIPLLAVFYGLFYQVSRNALCTATFDEQGISSNFWGRVTVTRWDDIAAATVYVPKGDKGSKIFLTMKNGKLAKYWDMGGPMARLIEAQINHRRSELLFYVQEL